MGVESDVRTMEDRMGVVMAGGARRLVAERARYLRDDCPYLWGRYSPHEQAEMEKQIRWLEEHEAKGEELERQQCERGALLLRLKNQVAAKKDRQRRQRISQRVAVVDPRSRRTTYITLGDLLDVLLSNLPESTTTVIYEQDPDSIRYGGEE